MIDRNRLKNGITLLKIQKLQLMALTATVQEAVTDQEDPDELLTDAFESLNFLDEEYEKTIGYLTRLQTALQGGR